MTFDHEGEESHLSSKQRKKQEKEEEEEEDEEEENWLSTIKEERTTFLRDIEGGGGEAGEGEMTLDHNREESHFQPT